MSEPMAAELALTDKRNTPLPDKNRLWADSGFVCGNPDCPAPVLEAVSGCNVTLGKIAHIRGHRPGAARYDPEFDRTARESYSNLIILCDPCHKKIDDLETLYPVELLQTWKDRQSRLLATFGRSLGGSTPPPLSHRYVDRPEVSHLIIQTLATDQRVVLTGLSGCGKTQLAAHLIGQLEDSYTFRWWIRGSDTETLQSDLAGIGPSIGVRSDQNEPIATTAGRVIRALRNIESWLMVIDDVSGSSSEFGLLPQGVGNVIVTTQNSGWRSYGTQIIVPALSAAQSKDLLISSGHSDPSDFLPFEQIHGLYFGHPLVIAQAASYIATTGMSPARYVALLETRRAELLARGEEVDHANLTSSVELALTELSAEARDMLHVLAQLAPAPYPVRELVDAQNPLSVFRDDLTTEDALAELRRFSLVERDSDLLTTHALIKDVVRGRTPNLEDRRRFLASLLLILVPRVPERPDRAENRELMAFLIPHLMAVVNSTDLPKELDSTSSMILNRTSVYLLSRGEFSQAKELLMQALANLEGIAEEESALGLGAVLNNLGTVQTDLGDRVGAEETLWKALEVKEKGLPEGHLAIGITLGALGAAVDFNGRPEEARTLHERALKIYRQNCDIGRIADALNDLAALSMRDRDNSSKARQMLEEAIALTEDAPDAWAERVQAYTQISYLYFDLGDRQGAARAARRAVDIARAVAPASEELAMALHRRGGLMTRLGNSVLGMKLFDQSLAILQELGQSNGLEYARTSGDLGAANMQNRNFRAALPLLRDSDEKLSRSLAANHESVITAKNLLSHCLISTWEFTEARGVLTCAITAARDAGGSPILFWLERTLADLSDAPE